MCGRNVVKLAILVTAFAAFIAWCDPAALAGAGSAGTKSAKNKQITTKANAQVASKAGAQSSDGKKNADSGEEQRRRNDPPPPETAWSNVLTEVALAAAAVAVVLAVLAAVRRSRKARHPSPEQTSDDPRFADLAQTSKKAGQELEDEVKAKRRAGMLHVPGSTPSDAEEEASSGGSGDPVQRLNNRMDMAFPRITALERSVEQLGGEVGNLSSQVEELKRSLAPRGQVGARGGAWPQQDVVRVADRAAEEAQRDLDRFRELLSLGETERKALFQYFDDRSRKVAEVNKVLAEVEKARDLGSYLNSSFYEVEPVLERYPDSRLPELPGGTWLQRVVPKCAELAEQQARRAVIEAGARLERKGLRKMKIEKGQTRYDDKKHQTTPSEPVRYDSDYPEGTIAEEVSSGWELNGRTVKPAMVRIYARKQAGSGTG